MGEVAEKAEHSDADVGNLNFLHTPETRTVLRYKQNDGRKEGSAVFTAVLRIYTVEPRI